MSGNRQLLIAEFANRLGVEPEKLLITLKATCFKLPKDKPEITNEQMMALLIVAKEHNLNPFTKEIYAYPDKAGGIVPVIGIDGMIRKMNEHPQTDGIEFEFSDEIIRMDDKSQECPAICIGTLYRKDRKFPIKIRAKLREVYVAPRGGFNGPWQTHTERMLMIKTGWQLIRWGIGFANIYDEDEAKQILISQGITIDADEEKVSEAPKRVNKKLEQLKEKLASKNSAPVETVDTTTGEIKKDEFMEELGEPTK